MTSQPTAPQVSAGRVTPSDSEEMDLQTALLRAIRDATGPIGARDIRRLLTARGHGVSEATVSRRLCALDELGLSVPVQRKGRILTADGRRLLQSRLRGREQSTLLDRLGEVHTVGEVLHLLRARRAIEPEAVRDGAGRVDRASLSRLAAAVQEHDRALSGGSQSIPRSLVLGFHRTVTSFTDNPLIAAMTRIALDPTLDHVEAMLDVILQTHHTSSASISEHARICEAFVARDGQAAAAAMREHLDRLINETLAFTDSHGEDLANRLLNSNRQQQGVA